MNNKNIFILFLSGGLSNFLLVMPIIVLFFQESGLTMVEIMILQVIYSALTIILEIPSGYLADRFKRKYSLNLGFFLGALGMILYVSASSFSEFLLVEIILGVGYSFISGADGAFLYDELLSQGDEKKYQMIEGRYTSLLSLSESVAAFLSSILAIISFKLVIIVQASFMLLGFTFSLFLSEKRQKRSLDPPDIGKILGVLQQGKQLKLLIIFSALISTSTLTFLRVAQPFWKESGLPLIYFGIIWGILNLLVTIFSLISHKLENYFPIGKVFTFFCILSFIIYIALAYIKNIYIILLLSSSFWILRGLSGPILKGQINILVNSHMRATLLSIKNLVFRIVFSLFSPLVGVILDVYSINLALYASGLILGIGSIYVLVLLLKYY